MILQNFNLIKAETLGGRKVAESWDKPLKELEGQYKAATKMLAQKQSTLCGTLFGDDYGAENQPSMFSVEVRTEDRYTALQHYVDVVKALKNEIQDAVNRRNSSVRNADQSFRAQLSLNDLIEFQ